MAEKGFKYVILGGGVAADHLAAARDQKRMV